MPVTRRDPQLTAGKRGWARRRVFALVWPGLFAGAGCFALEPSEECDSGCGLGTCGEAGVLRFVDATTDPLLPADSERRILPLALGASLDVEVQGGDERDEPREIQWAWIDEPARADVEVRAGQVRLTALSLGDARLEVGTATSEEDALSLEVREVATMQIVVGDFPMIAELAGAFDDSEPYEFALTPGARAVATARMLDDGGEALSGHGLATWTIDPSTAALIEPLSADADAVEVVATGGADTIELVLDGVQRQSWPVRDAAQAVSYEWWLDGDPLPANATLVPGQTAFFIGLARDVDGLALVPSTDDQLRLTVSGDTSALLVREDELLDVVQVEAAGLGTVDVTLSYLGTEATTRLQIVPAG